MGQNAFHSCSNLLPGLHVDDYSSLIECTKPQTMVLCIDKRTLGIPVVQGADVFPRFSVNKPDAGCGAYNKMLPHDNGTVYIKFVEMAFYGLSIDGNEENALACRCPKVVLFINHYILQYESTTMFFYFINSFCKLQGNGNEAVEIFGIFEDFSFIIVSKNIIF